MGRPTAPVLTERELEVMHVFWEEGAATALEARDRLESRGLTRAYTTIATLVRILYDKGFLRQVSQARPFRYQPARTYEEVSESLLGDLVRRVFRNSRVLLLKRLLQERDLSDRERAVLADVLHGQGA